MPDVTHLIFQTYDEVIHGIGCFELSQHLNGIFAIEPVCIFQIQQRGIDFDDVGIFRPNAKLLDQPLSVFLDDTEGRPVTRLNLLQIIKRILGHVQ